MSAVEHEVAVYIDGLNVVPIKHADILKEQKNSKKWPLTELAVQMSRAKNLFTPDLKNRLEFRSASENGNRIPLFAFLPTAVARVVRTPPEYPFENDGEHNFRVSQLCDILNRRKSWDLKVGNHENEQTFLELNGYIWTVETTRIYSTRGCVRHDILGQQPKNRLLPSAPAVAIETVKQHWPSADAMEDMLLESKKETLIVLFDWMGKHNTALKTFPGSSLLKPAVYISGGAVCRDGEELLISGKSGQNVAEKVVTPEQLEGQVAAAIANLSASVNQGLEDYRKRSRSSSF